MADLVVALLGAGLPSGAALSVLRGHLAEAGLTEPTDLQPVFDALDLAAQTGLAPGPLVRAAAAEQRRGQTAARTLAAGRLAVVIALPMGLCLLPAFLVLTVVPLVIALVR
jgi:hypothetical protein